MEDYEFKKKQKAYELELAEQVCEFGKRINKGEATPEEIAYMSKVASLLDEQRTKAIKDKAFKVYQSAADLSFL